ncbi:MAG: EamA family transporter, partial [Gammaproteobacteria bacterium]|nr:EamA family transporter [Gammaproteobacteria bacterium]
LIGIASGGFFGLSGVFYRAGSLSLDMDSPFMQASFTLAVVTVLQTLGMSLYLRLREPGQITKVFSSWKVSGLVGVTGMLGSVCWFTAMTLQNVAYVRALGQVELVFTFIVSYLFFKERATRIELAGVALIIAGILVLLLTR